MKTNVYKLSLIIFYMKKKSREEISDLILSFLEDKPLSIQQISENVGSNWMTVNQILEQLKSEGKVKEVVATDKIKIFRRANYPVFYGVPIRKEIRNKTLFIASEIVKEWKEKNGELPLNTTLQKVTVEIIKKCNLNLPVLPLHYGLVTALAIKPEEQIDKIYEWTGQPERNVIIKKIKEEVPKHVNNASEEEDLQYLNHNLNLFKARKEIIKVFKNESAKADKNKLKKWLLNMSLFFPTENLEIYNLFDRYLFCSTILLNTKSPEKNVYEIKETFNIVWDLVTTEMFLREAKIFVHREDMQLFDLIMGFHLDSKINTVEERITNLEYSVNAVKPEEIETPMDKESMEIRRILAEGAEEE